jgi:broad specificity phosphatase PhoE
MARMSEVLFIRHAETDMAGTFCGHSNPGLNARGRRQLSELICGLEGEEIDEIYTSDLLRAQETAEEIAKFFEVGCHLRPELREINFGRWEGLTWEEIEQNDPAYAQRWIAEYPNLSAPNGECFDDFERRVLNEVEQLTVGAKGRGIAVVTHAGVLRTVLCRLLECSDDEARQQTRSYCSVIRYRTPVSTAMRPMTVRF